MWITEWVCVCSGVCVQVGGGGGGGFPPTCSAACVLWIFSQMLCTAFVMGSQAWNDCAWPHTHWGAIQHVWSSEWVWVHQRIALYKSYLLLLLSSTAYPWGHTLTVKMVQIHTICHIRSEPPDFLQPHLLHAEHGHAHPEAKCCPQILECYLHGQGAG